MSRPTKRCADSRVTLSAMMGPQDTNGLGNVHGGVIMKMVDEAGGLAAMRHASAPVVTVVMDSMTFLEPIRVGDMVQCTAELTYVGNTSMEIRVEVLTENPLTGAARITNTAYLVYVALDTEGRPTSVPGLEYVSDDERMRGQRAQERQQYRKQRAREESVSRI
jgi:uncharacterized protein (TIGR00369 family)